jgi:redox-sensitive bicupin YhaK (pirin superfamily)
MASVIIPSRPASIGAFAVERVLPWRNKRMCGPFIFLDHMGPHDVNQDSSADVLAHPHIGLSTLTWLLSGELMHRDSLGTVQRIKPGEVNWMTAGQGIVHSERLPEDVTEQTLEGLQLWIALPEGKGEIAPDFQHLNAEDIPSWQEEGLRYQLIAGEWNEHVSPLRTHSDLLMVDLTAEHQGEMDLDFEPGNEIGVYLLSGALEIHEAEEDVPLETGQLFVANEGFSFSYSDDAHFILLGGETFETVPNIWWNFVSFDPQKIEQAKTDWKAQAFDPIDGESEFVPLPEKS